MFLAGDPVQITPRGQDAKAFWSFVDGWTGTVRGAGPGGRLVVVCTRDDGEKQFLVEPDSLTKLHTFGRT